MKHSIAFGTGATYGLGHAAGRLFATEGYREVIVDCLWHCSIPQVTNNLRRRTNDRKHLITGANAGLGKETADSLHWNKRQRG